MAHHVLEEKIKAVLWVSHSLFERGKATGSSANISFRHEQRIYISRSGSCFGTMEKEDFAVTDLDGMPLSDVLPSRFLMRSRDRRHFFQHLASVFSIVMDFC